jgi:hypothetical protein
MTKLAVLALSIALPVGSTLFAAAQAGPGPDANAAGDAAQIVVPAGTKMELAVTMPVRVISAAPGNLLYAQTDFPVIARNRVVIPAGAYVQGRIEAVTRPTRRSDHAGIDVLFTKIVFANGYVVGLPLPISGSGAQQTPATAARLTIEASQANDLLLDNGAQIEMTLAAPLALDAGQVAASIALSRTPAPGKFKSATLCRPTPGFPGTPGTPDTVIPGDPGTPDTTVPGGPGMPDITIPGTPPSPPTVIPGDPGTPDTPGTSCPAAPIVVRSEPIVLTPEEIQTANSSAKNP